MATFRRVSGIYAVLGLAILAQAASGRLGSPVAVVPIVLGCLAWLVVGRAERAATPLRAWVVVMLVAAITAVVELAVGMPSVAGNEHAFYALKARITTPIGDHNELASGLLVAVAVAAASRRARLVRLLLALGLGATLSRGALVAGAVGLAGGLVLRVEPTVLRRGVAAVAVAGGLVAGATMLLDTSVPPDGPTSSVSARTELWGVAVDDVRSAPWLGVGLGGFEETAVAVPGPHDHAHNGTLHAMAELGVLAGLAAAIRLPLATWLLLRRRDDRWLQAAGLGGLLLLVHDQVEALALHAMSEVVIGGLLALATHASTATQPQPHGTA